MYKYLIYITLLFCCSCGKKIKNNNTGNAGSCGIFADNAMVVSAHPEATKAGINILEQGGNAVDAAIAVQYALAVVYPVAGNIGGGGFMVIRLNNGSVNTLDFREKAPVKAYKEMYLDSCGEVIEGASMDSGLAVGVPGTVDGMIEAHKKYGNLSMDKLIMPSINLARTGFPVTQNQADRFNAMHDVFVKKNPGRSYLLKDEKWEKGDTLCQPDLAKTLDLIRQHGKDGFYKGITAENFINEVKNTGGIITHKDLEQYRSEWRQPVAFNYKEYKIFSMPPPSSGGTVLFLMMKMAETFPVNTMQHNSVEYIHLLAEIERRAFADRASHLGDCDFYPVPSEQLLDSSYAVSRMVNFDPGKATDSDMILAGDFADNESMETTHFSVVDSEGNAVAVTTTINAAYGTKIFVTGSGFLLNNEMDDFSIKPGHPNMFGLTGGEANAVEPEKRMLSSMTPTIIEKNNKLFMVTGSPGGSTIITSVFQTILNVIEFDMSMQEAVSKGRFHHQWKPDIITLEDAFFSYRTIKELQNMGHKTEEINSIGRVNAILIHDNGKIEGGADPRRDNTAIGF